MIWFDTESCGFFGPTILIQYIKDNGDPVIHNIFESNVKDTLDLIEKFINEKDGLIGFNLAHDMYHLNRTYSIFRELPKNNLPDVMDIHDVEVDKDFKELCLNPYLPVDLLVEVSKGHFQSALKSKPIKIKKFPKALVEDILPKLNSLELPSFLFSKGYEGWKVKEVDSVGREIDAHDKKEGVQPSKYWVNLELKFSPSRSLKTLMHHFGEEVEIEFSSLSIKKIYEESFNPQGGFWLDYIDDSIKEWQQERKLKYALKDPVYTKKLYYHLNKPGTSRDSELAVFMGQLHWCGFPIDTEKINKRIEKVEKDINWDIPFNSPIKLKEYINPKLDFLDKLSSTDRETLENVINNSDAYDDILVNFANEILKSRKAYKEKEVLTKLKDVGRFHPRFNVVGTKSNRMSGGGLSGSGESMKAKGGAINPQGIKKEKDIREAFIFKENDLVLSGGDFDSFEVTIEEAVVGSVRLRQQFREGKKIHAIWGSYVYGLSYEEVLSTDKKNEKDEDGYYARAKRSFFAKLYGSGNNLLAEILKVRPERIEEADKQFKKDYPEIAKHEKELFKKYYPMEQKIKGGEITWREPEKKAKSLLGFERDFSVEYDIIKKLYTLTTEIHNLFGDKGKNIKLKRRDRVQTATGASASSIYATAFGLCGAVFRSISNHEIQSTGAEITKELQLRIFRLQEKGISSWTVKTFQVHDEILTAHKKEVMGQLNEIVSNFVKEYQEVIPFLGISWKNNLNNWSEV